MAADLAFPESVHPEAADLRTVYSKPENIKDCFSPAHSKQVANPTKTFAVSQKLPFL